MITRSLHRNVNQRRVVGENEEQNGGNRQQNNGNNHHSEPTMEDDEIRRALLDVNGQQNEQNQQLNADEERRLLDQSNLNGLRNLGENFGWNLGNNRQNENPAHMAQRLNNFMTSTPNISPGHQARQNFNFVDNRVNRRVVERPRDARGRFIRIENNDEQECKIRRGTRKFRQ
ncbi:hypothetical protein niasHT_002464 [Heterodera trifolii]|uniref:Uncharacterized protein n=1 Tax=Heterodera trifolii TaxID=157864 RepID=A0ABD2LMP8_9BILA